jgi:tRNA(fMet)-specific endonuclease VapC
MKIILDTNAYSAFMRGHPGVAEHIRRAERVFFSAVVVGELLFGFHYGKRYKQNLEELEAFLSNPYVEFVPVTMNTADRFGRIAAILRRKGTPLPTNDIWIAAHALETGADLISHDQHFRVVDGLIWVSP